MKLTVKKVIPIVSFFIGVLWTFTGITKFGFMDSKMPTAGFFPIIIGILLCLVSILALKADWNNLDINYELKQIYPVLAVIAIVGGSYIIGLLPSVFVYLFLWLYKYEKYSLKFSLIFSVLSFLVINGVFSMWLKIPFPTGLF